MTMRLLHGYLTGTFREVASRLVEIADALPPADAYRLTGTAALTMTVQALGTIDDSLRRKDLAQPDLDDAKAAEGFSLVCGFLCEFSEAIDILDTAARRYQAAVLAAEPDVARVNIGDGPEGGPN